MTSCIFCRIVERSIPVDVIFEDEQALVFPDTNPQAPTHLLAIPKQHFTDVEQVPKELLGHLLHTAAAVARQQLPGGHRIVINTGDDGGQTRTPPAPAYSGRTPDALAARLGESLIC